MIENVVYHPDGVILVSFVTPVWESVFFLKPLNLDLVLPVAFQRCGSST